MDIGQWELSKENIQPIKHGRKASILTNAFDDSHQQKLNSERHEFEQELRVYEGEDPLDIWYRYIIWVEQNYPSGGTKGNLVKLIESCFSSLCSKQGISEKYCKDERFLDLWTKYASLCPCPLDVYQSLFQKNMFTELAKFYEIWAWVLEEAGNFKKANAVFLEGSQRKAKPLDDLEISYSKFQARFAQITLQGMSSPRHDNSESELQRRAFSVLKVKGSKARAPVERVSTVMGSAGRISTTAPPTNKMAPNFKIFQDENAPSTLTEPISESDKKLFIPHATSVKENDKKASVWTKSRMKQATTQNISVTSVSQMNQPTFQVYSDETAKDLCRTPAKRTEFTMGVLSERKSSDDDWKVPLFVAEPFNPNAQPQYCKQLVYCGSEEFSFEELRALARKKEEITMSSKEEINELREMLKRQEEMITTLMQKQKTFDDFSAEKSTSLEVEVRPAISMSNPTIVVTDSESSIANKKSGNSFPESRPRLYEDSWVAINKSVSFAANAIHDVSNVYDESTTKALLALQPATASEDEENISLASHSGNNSRCSPRRARAAKECLRSPTVNTKIAKNIIHGFFDGTLSTTHCEGENSSDVPQANELPLSASFKIYQDNSKDANNELDNLLPSSDKFDAPFSIYCDEVQQAKHILSLSILSSQKPEIEPAFEIYCDENVVPKRSMDEQLVQCFDENQENIPPPDMQFTKEKRTFAGVLKPSTYFPIILSDEKERDDEEEEEGIEGVQPLLDEDEVGDNFTIKLPMYGEAFTKNGFVASTPCPLSLGFVPQVKQEDDDFTMAVPIRSSPRKSILAELATNPISVPNGSEMSSSDPQVLDKSEENSGELMPPPFMVAELHDTNILTKMGVTQTTVKYLSPILEASREYRSSTSSSSGGSCSVFSTHSNIHGFTSSVSRSINFSQTKVGAGEHDPCSLTLYGEYSKSGYVADKSQGESINDHFRKRTKSEAIEEENFDTSFDPNKIAAMILSIDDVGVRNEDKFKNSKEGKSLGGDGNKNSVGTSRNETEAPSDKISKPKSPFSPLARRVEYPVEIDPFDTSLQETLLRNLKVPVNERGGFVAMDGKMPVIKPRTKIRLGSEMYNIKRAIGSGAYAQVLHASTVDPMNVTIADNDEDDENESDESQMILKVQKPACAWEFYVCHELRERLKSSHTPERVLDSFMRVNRGYVFAQGSILVSQYHKMGTLIDVINKFKSAGKSIPEVLVFFFMAEIISLLIALHSCNIVHGDLKPDNVLLVALSDPAYDSDKSAFIKFIDFGRSIDLSLYPPETSFVKKVMTDRFTCCEMQDNRPWTFQTDFYGLASIAHCLLWGTYMNAKKEKEDSTWKPYGVNYYRYMKKTFWQQFFHKMLNIPSCNDLPNMHDLLKEFEDQLKIAENLETDIKRLRVLLGQR